MRSVKVGGSVVYSTCTLSSMQNEGVVENAAAIANQRFGLKVLFFCLYILPSVCRRVAFTAKYTSN